MKCSMGVMVAVLSIPFAPCLSAQEMACPSMEATPVRIEVASGMHFLVLAVENGGPGSVAFKRSVVQPYASTPKRASVPVVLHEESYLISSRSQGAVHWIPDLSTISSPQKVDSQQIKAGELVELWIPAESIVHDAAVTQSQYRIDLRARDTLCQFRSSSFVVKDMLGGAVVSPHL